MKLDVQRLLLLNAHQLQRAMSPPISNRVKAAAVAEIKDKGAPLIVGGEQRLCEQR